jgi:hypothetical protein
VYLPSIHEFASLGINDPGVPGKECVVFRAESFVNTGQFALVAGPIGPQGLVHPSIEHFLLLPDIMLSYGEYLFVFTGVGRQLETTEEHSKKRAVVVYWGKYQTLFRYGNNSIVPALIKLSGIEIIRPPQSPPPASGWLNSFK